MTSWAVTAVIRSCCKLLGYPLGEAHVVTGPGREHHETHLLGYVIRRSERFFWSPTRTRQHRTTKDDPFCLPILPETRCPVILSTDHLPRTRDYVVLVHQMR